MNTTPVEIGNDASIFSPFYESDGFSYFCKYDELVGVVACPGVDLPPVEKSCYVNIKGNTPTLADE